MAITVTIEEARARLKDLIHGLAPGDELIITENQQPLATLLPVPPTVEPGQRPPPGLGKGMITIVTPDFDAPLEDMKEYME